MSDMETRSFEVRAIDEEARTVAGVAVPYNETVNVGGYRERFEPGAFGDITDVKLFYGHSEPIGKVVRGADTEAGFEIEAVISKTARGEEVYTLLRDGVLNKFSVGFVPVEDRMDEDVVVRTKADLREVSVVPFPAYSQANILSVRNESETAHEEGNTNTREDINTMSENTNAPEVAELREAVSMLERKVEVLSTVEADEAPVVNEFRSAGEYMKAYAAGDDKAVNLVRAYTGGTSADSVLKNGWAADAVRLIDKGRKAVNAFSKATLPAEGMNVEYAVLDTNTLAVGQQVAEGDTLAFGKVSVTSAQAPVITLGGYSTVTRQEVERGSVNILDVHYKGMAIAYAAQSEKVVRDAVVAATGTSVATLSADSAAGWLGLLADSAGELEDEGLTMDFILVSPDVFKRLATLVASDGRPLLSYNSGANTIGGANVKDLTANINGVPVLRDSALAANTCIIASKDAVRTFESAGSPFRLGPDGDPTTLTQTFSIYGYMAVAIEIPTGLVKADVDLVA